MSFENRYTWSARLLHRLAFKSGGIQVALADIEAQLYKSDLEHVVAERPVFVTALPRAGTTILLNVLVESGSFASHTYRDMPFVLCPMIWSGLTRGFHTHEEQRERAHGDGLSVGYDSPEAFEEMIWKHFWPKHYESASIVPWSRCDDPEFVSFFSSHMKKIVALRTEREEDQLRYLSKNNLNISRLACLPGTFPDARFVVPFREPVQHAGSLLKQHLAFLEAHRDDVFSRQYMEGIGHYDFGLNLRPVNFDGWADGDRRADAVDIQFWVEYWIAAYRNVLTHVGGAVRLVSYRRLTEEPKPSLESIASFLGMERPQDLVGQAAGLHPPRTHAVDSSRIDPKILEEARQLYDELERRSEPNR